MRTATAVSKCVLTSPGSSTVLATASCDARFALAQKPKTEGRTPLETVQRSLLAVYALLWGECTAQDPTLALHGFYTAIVSDSCVASSVHLAVDWSRESSRGHRSQIPTSVDAPFYTNNLAQELCWTAGLLQPLDTALLADERCGKPTNAHQPVARAPLTYDLASRRQRGQRMKMAGGCTAEQRVDCVTASPCVRRHQCDTAPHASSSA